MIKSGLRAVFLCPISTPGLLVSWSPGLLVCGRKLRMKVTCESYIGKLHTKVTCESYTIIQGRTDPEGSAKVT